jgi:hypothetical protein
MVDKQRDNRSSDDLLADLDALEELLGPAPGRSPRAGGQSGGKNASAAVAPNGKKGPAGDAASPSVHRNEVRKETDVAKSDRPNGRSRPKSGESRHKEEQIPLLEDVVYPGVKPKTTPSRTGGTAEPPARLPSRAEIDSWVELAIETRLEPLKKQLRRELWEELLRRFPALRGRDD